MKLDGLPSTVMPPPAMTLTFDLISMSQAQMPTWLNCDQITSNSYKHIVISHGISVNPYTIVTKIGWNSLHWFLRYGVHKVFGSLPAMTLTFDLWSQKLLGTSTSPNTYATKLGEIPFNDFWDMVFTKFSHRRTDPNTVCLRHRFSTVKEAKSSCFCTGHRFY